MTPQDPKPERREARLEPIFRERDKQPRPLLRDLEYLTCRPS
jgi:hypothetical protein